MASRKYYPTLVRLLRRVCIFIAKYRMQLESILQQEFGSGAVAALAAVMAACEQFVAQVEIEVNP